MKLPDGANREAGSVRVILADTKTGGARQRPRGFRFTRLAAVMLAALLASAGVIIGVRMATASPKVTGKPATQLDAKSAPALDATRLVLIGPYVLVDTRTTGKVKAGGTVDLVAAELPEGATAVALEVSILEASAAGVVAIASAAGPVSVLRAGRAGVMTSATAIVPIGEDRKLSARSEGGGNLLISLVGAFVPAESATAGRVVATAPTEVLRLVPRTGGKDARIDLTRVPVLRDAGAYAAVLLQVAADVGHNGGSLAVGTRPDRLDQRVFWAATSGTDRTRAGFLIVPVDGRAIHLHYQAGSLLTVDVVGYVTGDDAPKSVAGLVVPVKPATAEPVKLPAGGNADVAIVSADGSDAVPADRVGAAFVTLSAVGQAVGPVAVHAPDAAPPKNAILSAGGNANRQISTLVRAVMGQVRVSTTAGATITVTRQAIVLTG